MLKVFVLLLASLGSAAELGAQEMLIFDRAPSSSSNQVLGVKKVDSFLADDFELGAVKEDWVIDHIRLWAVADPKAESAHGLGELFRKISLLGGIAPDVPLPVGDCDCHNLPALKEAAIKQGSDAADSRDVEISAGAAVEGSPSWQIDFRDLKWSVPGGTRIQFGVLAEPRAGYSWYDLATPAEPGEHLRVFSSAGKFEETFAAPAPARINVQVWGHLLARISIRAEGPKLRVILWEAPFLDPNQIDHASLRFGPRGAAPESARVEDAGQTGKPALVMLFQPSASGIAPKSVNACLSGKRADGAPFEACDLVPH
ncbi:MAG: hypothetical protein WBV46_21135 [Terriglobales bacterium]